MIQGKTIKGEESQALEIIEDWKEDKKRGMLAIVGNKFLGKKAFAHHLQKKVGLPCVEISMTSRILQKEDVFEVFCKSLHIEVDNHHALLEHLLSMPPTTFVISKAHMCVLRRVDGYDGMRELLQIMLQSGHHHFWMCTFTLHTWLFLDGPATPINVDVFRAVIELPPRNTFELRNWIQDVFHSLNKKLDFKMLYPEKASKRVQRRTERAYWRLLCEEAGGNAYIALLLMFQGMSEEEDMLRVHMFEQPIIHSDVYEDDQVLFVLMTLVIHDGLTLDEIKVTLNVDLDLVQAHCRLLRSLNIVKESQTGVIQIHNLYWLSVTRLLVQKRLIYMGKQWNS